MPEVGADGLFDETGEIAFATATRFGEELAQGLISFLGDDEIPTGCCTGGIEGSLRLNA